MQLTLLHWSSKQMNTHPSLSPPPAKNEVTFCIWLMCSVSLSLSLSVNCRIIHKPEPRLNVTWSQEGPKETPPSLLKHYPGNRVRKNCHRLSWNPTRNHEQVLQILPCCLQNRGNLAHYGDWTTRVRFSAKIWIVLFTLPVQPGVCFFSLLFCYVLCIRGA